MFYEPKQGVIGQDIVGKKIAARSGKGQGIYFKGAVGIDNWCC